MSFLNVFVGFVWNTITDWSLMAIALIVISFLIGLTSFCKVNTTHAINFYISLECINWFQLWRMQNNSTATLRCKSRNFFWTLLRVWFPIACKNRQNTSSSALMSTPEECPRPTNARSNDLLAEIDQIWQKCRKTRRDSCSWSCLALLRLDALSLGERKIGGPSISCQNNQ